jgi:hypothetical protein
MSLLESVTPAACASPLFWPSAGAWAAAHAAYVTLAQLASVSPDAAAAGRAATYMRKAAEAAMKAGLLLDAEMLWRQLLDAAQDGTLWHII